MKPPIFETINMGVVSILLVLFDVPPIIGKIIALFGIAMMLGAAWLLWYSHRVVDKARKELKEDRK